MGWVVSSPADINIDCRVDSMFNMNDFVLGCFRVL